jgi:hypothetical protein
MDSFVGAPVVFPTLAWFPETWQSLQAGEVPTIESPVSYIILTSY